MKILNRGDALWSRLEKIFRQLQNLKYLRQLGTITARPMLSGNLKAVGELSVEKLYLTLGKYILQCRKSSFGEKVSV